MIEALKRYQWPAALALTGATLALLVLLYRTTLMAMVGIWLESDTFSHGFLVFPAVAFLVWRARGRLAAIQPTPSMLGFFALLMCLALWFVAHVGAVAVAEQFAFVAALAACTWALLGTSVLRAIAFAVLFAFFAVPFGDFVIPTLMRFTAWFVVGAIELSGIPVYRDGFMLSIPRGDFEVAKACSGIRYLIASLSLGTFYAYITFQSWKRRAAFVALAIAMPIAANGLRAYGIVMIAHFTNMQHAVGVDHLIYGWLFFGVLMFLMFFIGGRYAEYDNEEYSSDPRAHRPKAFGQLMLVWGAAMVAIVIVPLMSSRALAAVDEPMLAATLPKAHSGWAYAPGTARSYLPQFADANDVKTAIYTTPGSRIGVTIHTYTGGDRELVRGGNIFNGAQGHKIIRDEPLEVLVGDDTWTVGRIDMLERVPRRSILYWYQIGELRTASPNAAKAREWLARLSGKPTRRALITVSTMMDERNEVPADLTEFLRQHGASLAGCVSLPQSDQCLTGNRTP